MKKKPVTETNARELVTDGEGNETQQMKLLELYESVENKHLDALGTLIALLKIFVKLMFPGSLFSRLKKVQKKPDTQKLK